MFVHYHCVQPDFFDSSGNETKKMTQVVSNFLDVLSSHKKLLSSHKKLLSAVVVLYALSLLFLCARYCLDVATLVDRTQRPSRMCYICVFL